MIVFLFAGAAFLGCAGFYLSLAGEPLERTVLLLLWGALFLLPPLQQMLRGPAVWPSLGRYNRWARYGSWLILFATAGIYLFIEHPPTLLLPTAIIVAAALFTLSPAMFFYLIPAALIFGILIPSSTFYNAALSYPLRVVSTELSAALLSLFHIPTVVDGTVIAVGSRHIAVTTACSGIEQVEGLLLGATLIVVVTHQSKRYRFLHFSLLLPLIILFNTARLVVTITGWLRWGDVMLGDFMHRTLGWIMLILILFVFLAIGGLFPDDDAAKEGLAPT